MRCSTSNNHHGEHGGHGDNNVNAPGYSEPRTDSINTAYCLFAVLAVSAVVYLRFYP